MKLEFTGTAYFAGAPNSDWDGLTATVKEIIRDNGSKHYSVKFYDEGEEITVMARMYSNVDPAINAALGFTTGMDLGERA